MPSVEQNFSIYQGSVEVIEIAITDSGGAPIDLTIFDSLCWILTRNGAEIVRYLTADLGIISINGVNDGVRITLTPAITSELFRKRHEHQLWVTLGSESRPVSIGRVTVLRGDGC